MAAWIQDSLVDCADKYPQRNMHDDSVLLGRIGDLDRQDHLRKGRLIMNNRIRGPVGSLQRDMQARAILTRNKILEESAAVFDAHGYTALTVNALAAATGISKGAVYFHFSSKEAIARQLVDDWNDIVQQTITTVVSRRTPRPVEQIDGAFSILARLVADRTTLRAGMKLILDPAVDDGYDFGRWVESVDGLVDSAIAAGELTDTYATRRLAWNLCAGTIGTAHATTALREDVDFTIRIGDMVAAHLNNARATS